MYIIGLFLLIFTLIGCDQNTSPSGVPPDQKPKDRKEKCPGIIPHIYWLDFESSISKMDKEIRVESSSGGVWDTCCIKNKYFAGFEYCEKESSVAEGGNSQMILFSTDELSFSEAFWKHPQKSIYTYKVTELGQCNFNGDEKIIFEKKHSIKTWQEAVVGGEPTCDEYTVYYNKFQF